MMVVGIAVGLARSSSAQPKASALVIGNAAGSRAQESQVCSSSTVEKVYQERKRPLPQQVAPGDTGVCVLRPLSEGRLTIDVSKLSDGEWIDEMKQDAAILMFVVESQTGVLSENDTWIDTLHEGRLLHTFGGLAPDSALVSGALARCRRKGGTITLNGRQVETEPNGVPRASLGSTVIVFAEKVSSANTWFCGYTLEVEPSGTLRPLAPPGEGGRLRGRSVKQFQRLAR